MLSKILFLSVLFSIAACTSQQEQATEQTSPPILTQKSKLDHGLHNGDIIFHTSTSSQSQAIQLATNSPWSHMGMIYIMEKDTFVYEAISTVRLTPLKTWIARGKNKDYVVKRLQNADKILTTSALQKLKTTREQFKDKSYDLQFNWSDQKMYCSELVWKMYKYALDIEIGELQQLKDFNLDHPIVQAKIKQRYKSEIPKYMLFIAPGAMFDAQNLITIRDTRK